MPFLYNARLYSLSRDYHLAQKCKLPYRINGSLYKWQHVDVFENPPGRSKIDVAQLETPQGIELFLIVKMKFCCIIFSELYFQDRLDVHEMNLFAHTVRVYF